MVFDRLIEILLALPLEMLNNLPKMEFAEMPIPPEFYSSFLQMIMYLDKFFPMQIINYIMYTMLQLELLRINMAMFRKFKAFIPLYAGE